MLGLFAPIFELFAAILVPFALILLPFAPILVPFTPILALFAPILENLLPILELFTPMLEFFAPILELFTPILELFVPILVFFAPTLEIAPILPLKPDLFWCVPLPFWFIPTLLLPMDLFPHPLTFALRPERPADCRIFRITWGPQICWCLDHFTLNLTMKIALTVSAMV